MQKKSRTFILTFIFFTLTCLLLTYPKESLAFSLTGLQLWFNKMIPALLPFMILSGIMVQLNLTEHFIKILSPVLTPILRIRPNGIYAVVIGFLCGFPMGAKVIADLYTAGRLSKKEASFLLAFCNNIGPVYFISFVLPTLRLHQKAPYLFGMYGLPFLYGIFLRYTVYKNAFPKHNQEIHSLKHVLFAAEISDSQSLLNSLDDSILSALYSISKLGGYMVLFNLLNLIPYSFFSTIKIAGTDSGALINCLLEITSGISRMGDSAPLLVLLFLPFGGFSCIAQTYSMIKDTDLSLKLYVFHKLILSVLTFVYYMLYRLFFPSSFLI